MSEYRLIKKQEAAKIDFAIMLNDLLSQKNIKQSELARLSQKSKSLISRIMGGDNNLTIETMVTLLDAIGETLILTTEDRLLNEYLSVINNDWVFTLSSTGQSSIEYPELMKLESSQWQRLGTRSEHYLYQSETAL